MLRLIMKRARTISISVAPEIMEKAEKAAAQADMTVDELVGEALRRYLDADPEWEALLTRTRATGRALGVTSEAEVERLSDEFRRDRLERTA